MKLVTCPEALLVFALRFCDRIDEFRFDRMIAPSEVIDDGEDWTILVVEVETERTVSLLLLIPEDMVVR